MSFFFSRRRRHTRSLCDWSSDVCSSDLVWLRAVERRAGVEAVAETDGELVHDAAAEAEADRAELAAALRTRLQPGGRCDEVRSEERRVGKEWRSLLGLYTKMKNCQNELE